MPHSAPGEKRLPGPHSVLIRHPRTGQAGYAGFGAHPGRGCEIPELQGQQTQKALHRRGAALHHSGCQLINLVGEMNVTNSLNQGNTTR